MSSAFLIICCLQDPEELGKRLLEILGVPESSQQDVDDLTAAHEALKKQHVELQQQFEEQFDTMAGLEADNADKHKEILKLKGQLAKANKADTSSTPADTTT